MSLDRYHRQMLLPGLGEEGQQRLGGSRVLIVGCGALGSAVADALARAGVGGRGSGGGGGLTIVDRDLVELTNLQRQVLFDEAHVCDAIPKAEAARARIAAINSDVQVEAVVDDFNHRNAERYLQDADVIVDGLDNFETRYLLNDLAVRHHVPYVYGGAVGTNGMSAVFLPHPRHAARAGEKATVTWDPEHSTGCLRCLFPEAPPPGTSPTCDTAGVLGPVVSIIAAFEAAETLKLLSGNLEAVNRSLITIDLWSNELRQLAIDGARRDDCTCCGTGRFEYLSGEAGSSAVALCGRNAVQVTATGGGEIDLERMQRQLAAHGEFTHNGYLLRGTFAREQSGEGNAIELTLFRNGRAIVGGTPDPDLARTIVARYVGT